VNACNKQRPARFLYCKVQEIEGRRIWGVGRSSSMSRDEAEFLNIIYMWSLLMGIRKRGFGFG
jgi:hypothetical protein